MKKLLNRPRLVLLTLTAAALLASGCADIENDAVWIEATERAGATERPEQGVPSTTTPSTTTLPISEDHAFALGQEHQGVGVLSSLALNDLITLLAESYYEPDEKLWRIADENKKQIDISASGRWETWRRYHEKVPVVFDALEEAAPRWCDETKVLRADALMPESPTCDGGSTTTTNTTTTTTTKPECRRLCR